MKNIHVLPTDKPSRLHFTEEELVFTPKYKKLDGVNICITSDEEIKEGDWYINTFVSEREQKPQTHTEKRHLINHQKDYRFKYCKKIILTTDTDLINDGVQAIDDEFLEWFVKNPSCESVKVEGHIYKGQDETEYKIIIPSEEPNYNMKKEILAEMEKLEVPKQETLEEAQKQQFNYDNLHDAKEISSRIKVVETIEEASERIISDMGWVWENTESSARMVARHCAKSQERSYSEEDMRDYAIFYYTHQGKATKYWGKDLFKEWFKQFKKK
jgi:hypothetical protein